MIRTASTLVLLVLASDALAGPMPSVRQIAPRGEATRYVVSANLSKLVFWRLPGGEVKARR